MRRACVAILTVLWLAPVAAAEQAVGSFEELKLVTKAGEPVYVIDSSGAEAKARIFEVSDRALTLIFDGVRRDFREADIRRIDRLRRDPVRNGVLIGAAAGALVGFVQGRRLDGPSCPRSGIECGQGAIIGVAAGALWGSVGGWIVDAIIPTREVIYVAPTREVRHDPVPSPVVASGRRRRSAVD